MEPHCLVQVHKRLDAEEGEGVADCEIYIYIYIFFERDNILIKNTSFAEKCRVCDLFKDANLVFFSESCPFKGL